jgi:hypothetical protein
VLADTEHVGVIECKIGALRLCDVEVVPLGMRRWVERQEGVGRVTSSVCQGEAERKTVWVMLVRVL